MKCAFIIAAAVLLCARPICAVEARDPLGYERVLIPIYIGPLPQGTGIPGAYGSQWRAEFIARNEGDTSVQVFTRACGYFCTCVSIECAGGGVATPPHSQVTLLPTAAPPDGLILHVQKGNAEQMRYSLRVADVSRGGLDAGTELPVVRESAFRSDAVYLINIPNENRFRTMLRLYRLDRRSPSDVLVSVYAVDGQSPLATRVVAIPPPVGGSDADVDDDVYPGSVRIDLQENFPESKGVDRLRIALQPTGPGMLIWAFASVTNNDSQFVTTVTPQP